MSLVIIKLTNHDRLHDTARDDDAKSKLETNQARLYLYFNLCIQMALQVAKLLLYLDRCPLGSLRITKLTLSDFVLVRGTLVKLVDLDDLELGKKPCIDNSDCHFQGTNLGEFHLCNELVILSFSFLECMGLCFLTSFLGLFNVFTAYGFLILDLKIFCIL